MDKDKERREKKVWAYSENHSTMHNTADWHLSLGKRPLDILERRHIGLEHIQVTAKGGQTLNYFVRHICAT